MKQDNIIMLGLAAFLVISISLLGSPFNTFPFPEKLGRESVERGYLGVSIRDIPEEVLEAFGWQDHRGVLITEVDKDSPADKAGLQQGDVITEFDGKPVDDTDDLTRFVQRSEPGSEVQVRIMRQGKAQTIKVTLGELRWRAPIYPLWKLRQPFFSRYRFFFAGRLGLMVQNLNPSLGEYFQRESGQGVLVIEVEEDSPAEEAGFQPGDVIIRIDGEAVEDTEDLFDILRETREGDKLTVEILRKGKTTKLTLEIEDDGGLLLMGFGKGKGLIEIYRFPEERYRFEMDMNRLNRELDNLRERIHRQLRALDFDAIEKATELVEKRLQQALEKMERVTERLGRTTARLYRPGWVL